MNLKTIVLKKWPAMAASVCFLFFMLGHSFAMPSYSQEKQLTVSVNNVSLRQLFKTIEKQSEFLFVFVDADIDGVSVSVKAENASVASILNQALSAQGLIYEIKDRHITITPDFRKNNVYAHVKTAHSQGITVAGKVIDESGDPIPGVNVVVKGTVVGNVTGLDGSYTIQVPNTNAVLVFSFIGYITQEATVGAQKILNLTLLEDSQEIGEVVITALGIKREEKSLGYSVQKLGGKSVQAVKGTNIATSLTGKVAGLTIKNSTELIESPDITLRGGSPLIVIDEVAYGNMKLKDVSADDIESFDVLKGATASALYGVRGRNGAIMITTKKGEEGKLTVSASNNTMFNAGFLRMPKNQTSYASGKLVDNPQTGNKRLDYNADFVWGPHMDGSMVEQYDGISKAYTLMPLTARGKNNLKNFIENSFVTTTNLSVSQAGKAGSFRISATHSHTKGQFPNSKLSRYNFAAAGTIKYGNFKANANLSIGKLESPNLPNRVAYGSGNVIYNMMVWTGTDYDVRDFKDYWKVKDEKQNWPWTAWYDNPYFMSYENIYKMDQTMTAGSVNLNYEFNKYLKAQLRSGFDNYTNFSSTRQSIGGVQYKTGYYGFAQPWGWSWTNDFLLLSKFKVSDFKFDLLGGLSSYYYIDYNSSASTKGGLSIPGFYSLASSKEQPDVSKSEYNKLLYGAFGKISVDYKSMVYLDVTGRNDWSSTLSKEARSYFYPSVALSFVPSEIYNPNSDVLDFWKLRGSWTVSKADPSVYANNTVYSVSSSVWDDFSTGVYPTILNDPNLKPNTENSFEIGTDLRLWKGALTLDYTYFTKRQYNRIIEANISGASGFNKMYINTNEDRIQKGMEFTVRGRPVENNNFVWYSTFNIGFYHWYYNKFDDQLTTHDPRINKGIRTDRYMTEAYQYTSDGKAILNNGLPLRDPYTSLLGHTDPKFVFGFTNEFTMGDFDVSLSFDGRVGGVMYAQTNQSMWNTGTHPDSDNQYRYEEFVEGKRYLVEGVKITEGKLVADEYGNIQSDNRAFAPNDVDVSYSNYVKNIHGNAYTARPYNVVDATFIKLRELSVGYNLPKRWIDKFGLRKATIGIVGQNLFIWTKSSEFKYSDPDRGKDGLNSPSVRLIGVNLSVIL